MMRSTGSCKMVLLVLWNGPTDKITFLSWASNLSKSSSITEDLSMVDLWSSATKILAISHSASHWVTGTLHLPISNSALAPEFGMYRWTWTIISGRQSSVMKQVPLESVKCNGPNWGSSNVMEWHWSLDMCVTAVLKQFFKNRYIK